MAPFTFSVYPDIIGTPVRQHCCFRSHKRRIRGESGRLNHDDYHLHLSRMVIIIVETGLAFRLGFTNGSHVASAYSIFSSLVTQLMFLPMVYDLCATHSFKLQLWGLSSQKSFLIKFPLSFSSVTHSGIIMVSRPMTQTT